MAKDPEIISGLVADRDPVGDVRKTMDLLTAGDRRGAERIVRASAAKDREATLREIAAAEKPPG